MKRFGKLLSAAAISMLAMPAFATVWTYEDPNANETCDNNPSWCTETGIIETHEFRISYDDVTQDLDFYVKTSEREKYAPNNFWLGFTDGGMPDYSRTYGMLYGSEATSDVYAYRYEGAYSANDTSNHIETFDDVLTTTITENVLVTSATEGWSSTRNTVEFEFSINLASVNSVLTNDLQFSDTIGFWFQPFQGTIEDGGDGQPIWCFHIDKKHGNKITGWYDSKDPRPTTGDDPPSNVPEPAPFAMMIAGLGIMAYRKKRIAIA